MEFKVGDTVIYTHNLSSYPSDLTIDTVYTICKLMPKTPDKYSKYHYFICLKESIDPSFGYWAEQFELTTISQRRHKLKEINEL